MKVSFQAWARYQALATASFLFFTGPFSISYVAGFVPLSTNISQIPFYFFFSIAIGAYAIFLGIFMHIFERPCAFVEKLGPFTKNFYVRSILYMLLTAPLLSQSTTVVTGFCLFITACFYFMAAWNKEQWINALERKSYASEDVKKEVPAEREQEKKEKKKDLKSAHDENIPMTPLPPPPPIKPYYPSRIANDQNSQSSRMTIDSQGYHVMTQITQLQNQRMTIDSQGNHIPSSQNPSRQNSAYNRNQSGYPNAAVLECYYQTHNNKDNRNNQEKGN